MRIRCFSREACMPKSAMMVSEAFKGLTAAGWADSNHW